MSRRIIWSADVDSPATLYGFLRQMVGLKWVKLDRLFLDTHGYEVIEVVQKEYGIDVFADTKSIEIGTKLGELAKVHTKFRPAMLNCMAGSVSSGIINPQTDEERKQIDALKRFADVCHAAGTRPCGVTVLTSKTPAMARSEFGGRRPLQQVLFYAERLAEAGFTDVVCSPDEVKGIKAEPHLAHLTLNTPGIVEEGGDKNDQARTKTPEGAIEAGADNLVIGRALTTGDPAENFARISARIAHLN